MKNDVAFTDFLYDLFFASSETENMWLVNIKKTWMMIFWLGSALTITMFEENKLPQHLQREQLEQSTNSWWVWCREPMPSPQSKYFTQGFNSKSMKSAKGNLQWVIVSDMVHFNFKSWEFSRTNLSHYSVNALLKAFISSSLSTWHSCCHFFTWSSMCTIHR